MLTEWGVEVKMQQILTEIDGSRVRIRVFGFP